MDRRNTTRLQIGLKIEVEIGSIDPDENIRRCCQKPLFECATNAGKLAIALQGIAEAHHGQGFRRKPVVKSLSDHLWAADPEKLDIRQARPDRTDEMAG